MIQLVFATNNSHKLEEVQSMIADHFSLKSLQDIGCKEDIPETEKTLEGNAALKSAYILQHHSLDCFADDSGLEVEALGNEPGVYSARYSGSRDMEQNIDLVLKKLTGEPNRKAQFRTVISLRLNGQHHLFEGIVKGTLIEEKRGIKGFGYDPIFIPDGYQQTFAEMDPVAKNAISHRAIAIQKLFAFLTENTQTRSL